MNLQYLNGKERTETFIILPFDMKQKESEIYSKIIFSNKKYLLIDTCTSLINKRS